MFSGDTSSRGERGPNEATDASTAVGKAGLDKIVTLRLSASDWVKLEDDARELGIGPTTLIRMWVLERLRGHPVPSQDVLGAIELFLARAFREGILIRAESEASAKGGDLAANVLLQTPRAESVENTTRGVVFFGNQVLN
jgi:hypothetical protein